MEFLRPSRHRTLVSEIIYVLLNVLMALALFGIAVSGLGIAPALGLVLLSKWRIFAVRAQHWYANLVSNMVDVIVSVSFVVMLYLATGALIVQLVLTALYIAWLLFLKPQSKRKWVVAQAGVGLFVGVTALMHVSYDWWATPVVILMWVIGYTTGRHVLVAYKEPHFALLSLIWGLVVAELGWLFYHWNFAYELSFAAGLHLSQAAIIVSMFGLLVERTYVSIRRHGTAQFNEILLPGLLAVSSIVVLLTVFSSTGGV
ncbi:MAG TPA: hypothetical protein VGE13_04140 [Candidatus Saccharimonadales bacterium]